MRGIERVKHDLKHSTDLLIEVLANFSEEDFNRKPSANAWSAGEVAEHLWLVESAVNEKVMQGPTQQTKRDPCEKIEQIKRTFLDFEKKFSAALTKPTALPKNKKDMIEKIKSCRKILRDVIGAEGLEQECLGFNHGLFGLMTKVEWVYYNIYHTERHLQQIERIQKEIKIKAAQQDCNPS